MEKAIEEHCHSQEHLTACERLAKGVRAHPLLRIHHTVVQDLSW